MRPTGSPQQLAARRAQALQLLKDGYGATEVARRVGACRQTIYEWKAQARAKRKRPKNARGPGRECQLTLAQRQQLAHALHQGAYAHGYPEDHWTLDRVGRVIFDLFGVRYQASGVWYLLRRMGWSCQRPQRTGLPRDDAAVAKWQQQTWQQIKKVA